ncbi:MAG: hypothetical protein MUD12_06865 [Spirochaetes bacterium]|jgi:hypothetical protein|nr:hypothetical protein [Spirochaetota bacterium]
MLKTGNKTTAVKIISAAFAALLAASIPGCVSKKKAAGPAIDHFSLMIEQDGVLKDYNKNEVFLARRPFSITVSFAKPDGIFVSASTEPSSYEAARSGRALEDMRGFSDVEIADELFNRDKVIMLSRRSPNYWYYRNEGEHRFNEIISKDGIVMCKRSVSSVIDADKSMEKKNISALDGDSIYLVFISLEWNADYTRRMEKKREFIKINFGPGS